MNVIKKDGSSTAWDSDKIIRAVGKSAERAGIDMAPEAKRIVAAMTKARAEAQGRDVSVEDIHHWVIGALNMDFPDVAKKYETYRHYRKDVVGAWERARVQANETIYTGDRENANFDSTLISTKGSLVRGYLTKELYRQQYLTAEELHGIDEGFIYIHDLRDLIFNGINCCLFDIENLLKGGFEMAGMRYKEPKSLLSALQVIGDITLVATAQQFGGFTLPELDAVLVPYYLKSMKFHAQQAAKFGIKAGAHAYALEKTREELKQGLQSLEMKVNSVPSSRGDTAFTTVTFGLLRGTDVLNRGIQIEIATAILDTRMNGQGNGAPVVFPKLVYLHDEKQHADFESMKVLFNKAVECSSQCMYPDFLSLDAGELGRIYRDTGKAVSPMGCRAFLSDWKDANGESQFIGRANIGAVSLNLPMILENALQTSGGTERGFQKFWGDLDHWLEVIRKFHLRRYDAIANNPASTNPLGFTQGGFIGGNRKPNEKIGDIVNSFTASFGITALNELNILAHQGVLHCGNHNFAHRVLDFIYDRIETFKQQDGKLYAMYGTPAESLAGTQLRQFREKFGVIDGVSDREYFTNSFHMHVMAPLTPYEKQDLEESLFHKVRGGRIQYVRLDDNRNREAIAAVVKRGMKKGFYQGVNFTLAVCEDCGHRPVRWKEGDACQCGSHDITVIERTCGYLGVRYAKGNTRFNDSKMAEIKDRRSM